MEKTNIELSELELRRIVSWADSAWGSADEYESANPTTFESDLRDRLWKEVCRLYKQRMRSKK